VLSVSKDSCTLEAKGMLVFSRNQMLNLLRKDRSGGKAVIKKWEILSKVTDDELKEVEHLGEAES